MMRRGRKEITFKKFFGYTVVYPLETLFLLPALLVLKIIGIRASSALGGMAMKKIGPLLKSHGYGMRNLRMVFPEKSEKECRKILMKVWENFGRSFGEFPHSKKITDNPDKYVTIENGAAMENFLKEKKGGIFVSGHFSGWDAMLGAVYKYKLNLSVAYRKANNPYANWLIQKIRAADRLTYIEKSRTSAVKIVDVLRDKGYVGFLLDQHYTKGLETTFLGFPAKTVPTAARLGLKMDLPILVAAIHRQKGLKFRISLHDHFYAKDVGSTEKKVMQHINDVLGAEIRKDPENWFWVHRRWGKEMYK